MRITDLKADPLETGKTLVRVNTDDGSLDLGKFSSQHSEPQAFARWFVAHFKPPLVGRDPFESDRIWEELCFLWDERYTPQPVSAIDQSPLRTTL